MKKVNPDFVYLTDLRGNLLDASPAFLKRLGFSSEKLRIEMGQMARKRVESEFDIKKIAKDYLNLFLKLKTK